MCNMIEINGLKKYFKDVKAVDDISFRVKRGELFAFLGLNGAGKSTTISIICGQLAKDAGTVVVDGADIEQDSSRIKSEIGIVFQNSRLEDVYKRQAERRRKHHAAGRHHIGNCSLPRI